MKQLILTFLVLAYLAQARVSESAPLHPENPSLATWVWGAPRPVK